ncbi:MAG: hypothetical protein JRJ73_00040 [Deltaproteobacteria bacterium]|nr:hypothetical protein [Deltaproteobacteria bacterium]
MTSCKKLLKLGCYTVLGNIDSALKILLKILSALAESIDKIKKHCISVLKELKDDIYICFFVQVLLNFFKKLPIKQLEERMLACCIVYVETDQPGENS